ncbi:hypothetical protein Dda_8308 [Drechslerella dactyloides]|uniref:Uncharacterized protein n=1 Tax=Drechslerella dactyloides TaxID=74499 RepID=A0AAD6IRR0_DREDA|nr:hypothetical protein Dda_8308 [Drechslerella dactyloides]
MPSLAAAQPSVPSASAQAAMRNVPNRPDAIVTSRGAADGLQRHQLGTKSPNIGLLASAFRRPRDPHTHNRIEDWAHIRTNE